MGSLKGVMVGICEPSDAGPSSGGEAAAADSGAADAPTDVVTDAIADVASGG
jgi:hypothetical protein